MSEIAVRTDNLQKHYGAVRAVAGLDLEVQRGEIFGLLGPNGAGKTTTIRILMGLTRASSGHAEVLGLDPEKQAKAIRAETGYAMQQVAVDLYLTGRENLRIFAELFNLRGRQRDDRVDELLHWADLEDAADRLVRVYSGGMKRRLNLALSLVHRPALFFLDEPTLGLDIHSRRQLWRLIEEVKGSGTTVVLTTHYLEEANQLCDRVGIMDRGKLVALGPPERLKRELVDELHRLTVTFEKPLDVDEQVRSAAAAGERTEVTFSGSHARLWERLKGLQDRYGNEIESISFAPPTLDDVVMKLTWSGEGTGWNGEKG